MTLQPVTHIPAPPARMFQHIQEAAPSQIHLTWGKFDLYLATVGRRVITNKFFSSCACCGGGLTVGEQIRWSPIAKIAIHGKSADCVARAEDVRKTAQVLAHNRDMYHLKGEMQKLYRTLMGFEKQPGLLTQLALPAPKTRGNINQAVTPEVIYL